MSDCSPEPPSSLRSRVSERAGRYALEAIRRANNPTADHEAAIQAIVDVMAGMAVGPFEGRLVIGAPTGLGKTTALWAFLAALWDEGAWDFRGLQHADGILVVQSRVEQLCEMKRYLMDHGVDEGRVALLHSYTHQPNWREVGLESQEASEPAYSGDRSDLAEVPIVLLTNARVRGGRPIPHYLEAFRSDARTVLHDESLERTQSRGIRARALRTATGALEGFVEGRVGDEPLLEVCRYFRAAVDAVSAELQAQEEGSSAEGSFISLPGLDLPTLDDWLDRLKSARHTLGSSNADRLSEFLGIASGRLRVVGSADDAGVVQSRILVPESLRKVIVLDASYQVRKLLQLDPSLSDAEDVCGLLRRLRVKLSELKDWSRVTVHHMRTPSGRETMEKIFGGRRKHRWPSREVAKVLHENPGRPALIFTHVPRRDIDIGKTLRSDLIAAGIDVGARIHTDEVDEQGNPIEVPWVRFETWGSSDATNAYQHCELAFMIGVVLRDKFELTGSALGQTDDPNATTFESHEVTDLVNSEAAHHVFQAGSRGQARRVDEGRARPMDWFVIHRPALRDYLEHVMPGAKWEAWRREKGDAPLLTERVAAAVEDILNALEEDSTSIKKLKDSVGEFDRRTANASKNTFTRGINLALDRLAGNWKREGRSLVRTATAEGSTAALGS